MRVRALLRLLAMSCIANLRTGDPSRRSRPCQPILSDPGRSEEFSEVGYSLTVAISWRLSSEKTTSLA